MRRSLTLVAVFVVLAAGCAGPGSAAGVRSADALHNAADIAFAQALIPHHRAGIALASEVAKARPASRTLAEAIIVTQQDEVVRMTSWLDKWGVSPTPQAALAAPASPAAPAAPTSLASPASPASSAAPASLASPAAPATRAAPPSPPGPDGDPVRALAAQQADAIKIAQQEQGSGSNPAALDFARQIVESRTAQIGELTSG